MDTLVIDIMVVNAPKTMGANGVRDLTCCNKGYMYNSQVRYML
jgi:hypothetical protein